MVYNEEDKTKWTKDGRHWYFRVHYVDFDGVNKIYQSKMFETKKEAAKEEALFKLRSKQSSKKNFDVVATDFFNELSKTRKQSTVYTYIKDYISFLIKLLHKKKNLDCQVLVYLLPLDYFIITTIYVIIVTFCILLYFITFSSDFLCSYVV